MLTINSYKEFEALLGKDLGISDWKEISQERINLFADATDDHQWIHVDAKRAAAESPYGGTIAHGYLTLSMLPCLWGQIVDVKNIRMMVNYGMEKMKFGDPVPAGARIRLNAKLTAIENLRGICKASVGFKIEIEGKRKPALQGTAIFLYYFIE